MSSKESLWRPRLSIIIYNPAAASSVVSYCSGWGPFALHCLEQKKKQQSFIFFFEFDCQKKLTQIVNAFWRCLEVLKFALVGSEEQAGSLASFIGISAIVAERGKEKRIRSTCLLSWVLPPLFSSYRLITWLWEGTARVLTLSRMFVGILPLPPPPPPPPPGNKHSLALPGHPQTWQCWARRIKVCLKWLQPFLCFGERTARVCPLSSFCVCFNGKNVGKALCGAKKFSGDEDNTFGGEINVKVSDFTKLVEEHLEWLSDSVHNTSTSPALQCHHIHAFDGILLQKFCHHDFYMGISLSGDALLSFAVWSKLSISKVQKF